MMTFSRARGSLVISALLVAFCFAPTGSAQSVPPPTQERVSTPTTAPATPAAEPAAAPAAAATPATPLLSDTEMERFLTHAKVVKTKGTKKGVTDSTQATMSDGALTHDAHIQTIDEYKREFRSALGVELDFRDSWTYNVAAYRLDRMIGLNMVPVSVPGHYRSNRAAITWWVDDVMMDEGDRIKQKVEPTNKAEWARQMQMMRLFDQLIANSDRNLGNMLYTSTWRLWPIDHTRAFRKQTTLKNPAHVSRCERSVFEKLKALDRASLKKELGDYLDDGHIKAILARRDLIVKKLESLGPSVLYDK
jgi:hypothetical protein